MAQQRRGITHGLRFRVLNRDRFRCVYCGKSASEIEIEIDNVVPVSAGGSDTFDNLVTSCKPCNQGKKTRLLLGSPDDLELTMADVDSICPLISMPAITSTGTQSFINRTLEALENASDRAFESDLDKTDWGTLIGDNEADEQFARICWEYEYPDQDYPN